MATTERNEQVINQLAATLAQMVNQRAPDLIERPELAEAINQVIDDLLISWEDNARQSNPPPDGGLAQLIGLGPEAARGIGETNLPVGVEGYDEEITPERILGVGDLYYCYSMETAGVFKATLKLKDLFNAGAVRLSDGDGARMLYQYDRKQVLRYMLRDRLQAYRRVFGYTNVSPAAGAVPNSAFHSLFTTFMRETALFFRDKRISDVIRPQADRSSFGSIAIVRRAGLDLRNNLKHASYGHVNVMRIELLQLLDESFRIFRSPDVMNLFGADNAWDTIEEVLRRYYKMQQLDLSPRSQMANSGRTVLRWLAQRHVLNSSRAQFEALLTQIADEVEEWLTSAEALGIVSPRANSRMVIDGRTITNRRALLRESE